VGQHRQRHRPDPPRRRARAHGLTTPLLTTASGAKMGKTAAGAVWLNPTAVAPMISGSSGATPPMPMSAASCACSPTCPWTRSPASKRSGCRDQRGEEDPRHRGDRHAATAARRRAGRRDGAQDLRGRRLGRTRCRRSTVSGELAAGIGLLKPHRQGRPCRLQRRGPPPRPGRRGAHQRCRGVRRTPHDRHLGRLRLERRSPAATRQEAARCASFDTAPDRRRSAARSRPPPGGLFSPMASSSSSCSGKKKHPCLGCRPDPRVEPEA
jgi:hypothetical protein